jgi:endonuclease I
LTWNTADASDDFEMNRNNEVYNWQMNRNPFIDYPMLADYI